MNVIPYQEKYKKDFIQFNTDWIKDNFGFLEKEDLETFDHIEESLEKGAMIYFAVENENALAACMTKPMDVEGTWELCKLGSNRNLYRSHKSVIAGTISGTGDSLRTAR